MFKVFNKLYIWNDHWRDFLISLQPIYNKLLNAEGERKWACLHKQLEIIISKMSFYAV